MSKFEHLDSSSLDFIKTTCAPELSKTKGYVICDGYLMTGTFADVAKDFRNFEVYDDDIWMCSFPKSGTTWSQEMIWSILNGYENTKLHLQARFPNIDFNFLINKESFKRYDPVLFEKIMSVVSFESLTRRPRPRFIKTHLPFDLLPIKLQRGETKAKIIYITRNPRDACISLYHQKIMYPGFNGTLQQLAEIFIKDLVVYGPYWKNILSYWNQRHRNNIFIIRYEDMKKNLSEVITRVSEFLGKPLPATRVSQLCHHLSFQQMKTNPLVNDIAFPKWVPGAADIETTPEDATKDVSNGQTTQPDENSDLSSEHIRCGKVNQWKERIDEEVKEKFAKWEIANLKNTDYPLNYDV